MYKLYKSQFFKYCLVGGLCALQNLIILYFCTTILKIDYRYSIIIQFIYVNSLGFYLNRRYTFKQKEKNIIYEFLKYHMVMLSSLVIVLLSMYVLVEWLKIWYLYAYMFLTVVMTFSNFIIHKDWTFKSK